MILEKKPEEGEKPEKYWFDQQLEGMNAENKKRTESMQSEGDAAANVFKRYDSE